MSEYHLLPKVDRLGRPQHDLHRIGDGPVLTTLCAQAGMPLRRVPSEFWALDADDRGEPLAIVSCPCGQAHALPLLEGPQGDTLSEEGNYADCPRGYWFDGTQVWVLNTPSADGTSIVSS